MPLPDKLMVQQIAGLKADPNVYEAHRKQVDGHNALVAALGPGAAVQQGHITMSAGLGATAAAVITSGSTFKRGQFTVTPNGAGLAANPTVTLTFPQGLYDEKPWATVWRNGGTGALPFTVTESPVAPFSLIVTLVGVPTAGQTYIFRYAVRE